jgi:hypothetical protein
MVKLLESSGFMIGTTLGAIVQTVALSAITGGRGAAPAIAEGITAIGNAARYSRVANSFNMLNRANKLWQQTKASYIAGSQLFQGIEGVQQIKNATTTIGAVKGAAKILGNGAIAYQRASSEAMLESIEGSEHFFKQQVQEKEQELGRPLTKGEKDEIQDYSADLFSARYKANVGVLMTTNLLQDYNLFSSFQKISKTARLAGIAEAASKRQIYSKGLQKWVTAGALPMKEFVVHYGKQVGGFLVKNTLTEGLEESAQYAIDKSTNDYYTKKYNKEAVSFMDSVGKGVYSAINDKEGQESFWAGVVMGGLFSGIGAAGTKVAGMVNGKNKMVAEMADANNDRLNKAQEDLLTLIKTEQVLSAETENATFNHTINDEIQNANDQETVTNLRKKVLVNAVKTAKEVGKYDVFMDNIKSLSELSEEDFKAKFEITDAATRPKSKEAYINELLQEATNIKNDLDMIDERYINPYQNYTSINPTKKPKERKEAFVKYKAWEEAKTVVLDNMANLRSTHKEVTENNTWFANKGVVAEDMISYIKEKSSPDRVEKIRSLTLDLDALHTVLSEKLPAKERADYVKQAKAVQKELDIYENLHSDPTNTKYRIALFNHLKKQNPDTPTILNSDKAFGEDLEIKLEQAVQAVDRNKQALEAIVALENSDIFSALAGNYEKRYNERYNIIVSDLEDGLTDAEKAAAQPTASELSPVTQEDVNKAMDSDGQDIAEYAKDTIARKQANNIPLTEEEEKLFHIANPAVKAGIEAIKNQIEANIKREAERAKDPEAFDKKEKIAEVEKSHEKKTEKIKEEIAEKEAKIAEIQKEEKSSPVPPSELDIPESTLPENMIDQVSSKLGHIENVQLFRNLLDTVEKFAREKPEHAKAIVEATKEKLSLHLVGGTTDPKRNSTARGDLDSVFLHQDDVDNPNSEFGKAVQALQYYINDNGNNKQQAAIESKLRPEDKSIPIDISDIVIFVLESSLTDQKALEETTSTTQSEIEAKKADIEKRLGIKLPFKNTSLPVSSKTWGDRKSLANQLSSELKGVVERNVSMQEWLDKGYGRQLATWADETIVEFLEVADIERRRQESLNDIREITFANGTQWEGFYDTGKESNISGTDIPSGRKKVEKVLKFTKEEVVAKINAKYDAELKELESKTTASSSKVVQTPSDIETQKDEIERRRQEALFGNITPLEFETTDTKGRTRKTIVKTKVDENGFQYSFETTIDGKSSSTAHPKVTKQEFINSSIYKNLDQNSKEFIDELPEDAVILLQSIAISTDKNSAAGLGNGNITIGYVSKELGGRVDDIVLKYQPNEINAKYDAELKATEQQPKSNQFEQDKKADIEIGKVGNTEYEVKVDGVYYQGKKLNNPENKTHRQLIEADIERRRQEELKSITFSKGKDLTIANGASLRTDQRQLSGFFARSGASSSLEASKLANQFIEINAKYDAELEALEQQSTSTTQSEIDKKAEVERIREENDTLGKSILQKLGYKNENRLPNGNVKGGQAGWKIRFNIKNPKTGESYYVNETQDSKNNVFTITNPVTSKTFTFNNKKDFDTKRQEIYKEIDNSDYTKKAEILINFLLNYFGSNEKADSKNLQKHYILEDKNGSKREPFKHLAGGEIGESDFTIYIGSADDVIKFISDIRTKHPEILELLHVGNQSSDISIDDIFKGRIEGRKIGFSGYHVPTDLNDVTGESNFTFVFEGRRVNINYAGKSLTNITVVVEGGNSEGINWGYRGVFDENLKKDFPELYKNIRNIIGFQLYGNYLQGSNDEFLKLTGVDKINAKYNEELKALETKKAEIERRRQERLKNSITNKDKIVFGHPGIGKTYLKESGRTDVIDFDSDYKTKINEKFNLPKGFKARNDFQKSNKEEYQKAVRELWIEAKQEAKRTGKQLFASDMILLREFANDFDKVLTMSKDTFVNRAKQRNDYTEGETEKWKNSLDTEISKIDKSKVINTTDYLSDLFQDKINAKYYAERIEEIEERRQEELDSNRKSLKTSLTTLEDKSKREDFSPEEKLTKLENNKVVIDSRTGRPARITINEDGQYVLNQGLVVSSIGNTEIEARKNLLKSKFVDAKSEGIREYLTDDKIHAKYDAEIKALKIQERIESELPKEIADAITYLSEVPEDILGRDDLYLSIKEILNDNNINDEILINWIGINKDSVGHPKNLKSEQQVLDLIQKKTKRKTKRI